tara:strand:+ start:2718 stop:3200 length:483 start_codon:yes stop_codon:yes gene_type:complete
MTNEEKEQYFTAQGESYAELHPFSFDNFDVTLEPLDKEHGKFDVEMWEDDDNELHEWGTIYLDTYEGVSREDLIFMLQSEIFVHELAHASQHRTIEYELEREQDHDAEFGIKYAVAYNDVILSERKWTKEEAFEYLGITPERHEEIVSSLAATMEVIDDE